MSDSDRPSKTSERPSIMKIKARTEHIKSYGAIIAIILTNVVTLTTAITAHMKGEKEETAKASYTELSKAVEQLSKEQIELHRDLANLRGYISGQQNQPLIVKLDEEKPFAKKFEDIMKKNKEPKAKVTIDPGPAPVPKLESDPVPYKAPEISKLKK